MCRRNYGSSMGYPEKCEFTVVMTDFYNDLKKYLANLRENPNNIRGVEDIIAYNKEHTDKEGGVPGTHGAWPTGQDNFDRSAASEGKEDETYYGALEYIRKQSREHGIDAALTCEDGSQLDALLVPIQADGGAALQVAAKAGE
jgi:amidase